MSEADAPSVLATYWPGERKPTKVQVQAVAARLADVGDEAELARFAELLPGRDKVAASVAIELLYEVGTRCPACIAPWTDTFAGLLSHRNNRLVWGAALALRSIAAEAPEAVWPHRHALQQALEHGSVITVDGVVAALSHLGAVDAYRAEVMPWLLQVLRACPAKQIPQYAEAIARAVDGGTRGELVDALRARWEELGKPTRERRVAKVLTALQA